MKIYKIIVGLVTANVTLAALGDLPLIDTVVLSTDTNDIFPSGSFVSPTFTVTINNNNENGYHITASSETGSMFALRNSGDTAYETNYATTDGMNLQYTFSCSGITLENSNPITSNGAQTLSPANTPVNVISVTSPTAATVNQDMTCTFTLIGNENVAELFAGTYKDTITIVSDLVP